MMERIEKISPLQVVLMFLLCRFLFTFSFMPTVSIAPANQDAWLAELLGGVMVIVFCIPLLIIAEKFKNQSLQQNLETILGKVIGKGVGALYVLYLTVIAFIASTFLLDFLQSAILIKTPAYAIVIFMLAPSAYAAYKGIESIGRVAIVGAFYIVLLVIVFFAFNFNNMDFALLTPVLADSNYKEMLFGGFGTAARFCDGIPFFLFVPYFQKSKKYSVSKILIILIIAFTLMNTIVTIATLVSLSPGYAKLFRFPYYISLQQVSVMDIIQRIEFLNVTGWVVVFIMKISTTLLAVSLQASQVLNAKSYKPFVIPFSMVVFSIVVFTPLSQVPIFKTIIYQITYIVIFTAITVIPTIMMIVMFIRQKKLAKFMK